MFGKINQFLREVRTELDKVKWPSQQQTLRLTIVVLSVSTILGVYIGGIDVLLTKLIEKLLK